MCVCIVTSYVVQSTQHYTHILYIYREGGQASQERVCSDDVFWLITSLHFELIYRLLLCITTLLCFAVVGKFWLVLSFFLLLFYCCNYCPSFCGLLAIDFIINGFLGAGGGGGGKRWVIQRNLSLCNTKERLCLCLYLCECLLLRCVYVYIYGGVSLLWSMLMAFQSFCLHVWVLIETCKLFKTRNVKLFHSDSKVISRGHKQCLNTSKLFRNQCGLFLYIR